MDRPNPPPVFKSVDLIKIVPPEYRAYFDDNRELGYVVTFWLNGKQYKMYMIVHMLRIKHKRQGHGSTIVNWLLNQYDFVLVPDSIADGFWEKFRHDCGYQEFVVSISKMLLDTPKADYACNMSFLLLGQSQHVDTDANVHTNN